jgi:hypothetical protein
MKKEERKLMKSKKGAGTDIISTPLPPGTLYVVCLNKPLINLWAMHDRNSSDYSTAPLPDRSSVYQQSDNAMSKDDRVQGILSPEDEMLLYNEGLTDYY